MPIFRINDKLIYYAHVPKAGGSSVADYFKSMGARTAFAYGAQWRQRPRDRWSSTSPQHIDANSLGELFPDEFFDACFTVVRHPEDRIISEYKFRAERSKLHSVLPLSDWLHIVTAASRANPFTFDGHIRPQTDIIPKNCKVFKLENGLEKLPKWISGIINYGDPFPKFNHHSNKSKTVNIELCDHDRTLINTLYYRDFQDLGYEPRPADYLPHKGLVNNYKSRLLGIFSEKITNILSVRIPY